MVLYASDRTAMAISLKSGLNVVGLNETVFCSNTRTVSGFCPSSGLVQVGQFKPKEYPILGIDFLGKPLVLSDHKSYRDWSAKGASSNFSVHAQASICVSRAMRWWEKTLKPNMMEIHSAQELVDSLLNAGDRLVIVDFYSPGCGGCRTLHPKICQLAESHPNAIFLKVNYEELRTMCHSLQIHVLPFFRFYRGSEGKLCSFSCTNATIKKFKDALAKHGRDRSSLGPAKGLDESEILNLASARELSINSPLASWKEERVEGLVPQGIGLPGVWSKTGNKIDLEAAVAAGVL